MLANHNCLSKNVKCSPKLDCDLWVRRAGTIALAGDLGGLQVSNTGTGTVYTSVAGDVSGSGKTVVVPATGMHQFFCNLPTSVNLPHVALSE